MHQVQFLGECEAFFLSQLLLFGEHKISPMYYLPITPFLKMEVHQVVRSQGQNVLRETREYR